MSAQAAARSSQFSTLEAAILCHARQFGMTLADTDENKVKKLVAFCMSQISIIDVNRGVFKIDFINGGTCRYHKTEGLLEARVAEVAQEVVCGIDHSQFEMQGDKAMVVFDKYINQRELFSSYDIVDAYQIAQKHVVFVHRDPATFNHEALFNAIFPAEQATRYENFCLINGFISRILIHSQNQSISIHVPTDRKREITVLHKHIHERMQRPETGMAQMIDSMEGSIPAAVGNYRILVPMKAVVVPIFCGHEFTFG